eukprot:GHUV01003210.1.p2 GENE.GHUV01003210.1~~GHUV01003210.1.p2  ORF type:complete len:287 (+),score=88.52 GHUV01003210.1:1523-2383(+)
MQLISGASVQLSSWAPGRTHGHSVCRHAVAPRPLLVAQRRDSRVQAHRERVLRYPSGETRYIRYPVSATVDEEDDEGSFAAWDVTGLWSTAVRPSQTGQPDPVSRREQQQTAPSLQETAAYLEGLFAASYEAQPLVDVEHSYQIMHGCPWVLPRPVFVLACKGKGANSEDNVRNMYTLRTKVVQEGAAHALAKLLKKQHLAEALEVAEMHDGVVVFEHDMDADRYASMLEEEGHSQVVVAELDSHKLFRMVSDVRALVVLLPHGTDIPAPYQLAASLKKKKSWDSM